MNEGTRNYNKGYIPSEEVVSRTLQAKNRFWVNIVWRTGKPALDSEWNLLDDVGSEWLRNLVSSKIPSGWLNMGRNKFPIGNSAIANTFQFYSSLDQKDIDKPNIIVNGWPMIVGGVNYTDASLNSIELSAATTEGRNDFVFLEVFYAQVRSRDPNNNPITQNKPSLTEIYAYGNTQYGGTNLPDDIVDPTIKPSEDGIETSQRIQLQYRIRVVDEVTFTNVFSTGFDDTANVQGQGAAINPQMSGYNFTNMDIVLNDPGLWRAGAGDEASRTALGTADGYTYAVPMFKVSRRGNQAYNDTGANPSAAYENQQQNATVLADTISDRPDGKFNDGIDFDDILDMRFKVNFPDVNLDKIMEENLHRLFSGTLSSAKTNFLQYDSIADSDINGYTDFLGNEGTSGKRTVWSDTETDQEVIYAKVAYDTTDTSLDAYRSSGTGNWAAGNTITVQITTKLPTGTVIDGTPEIYTEDKNKTNMSTAGTWSGTGTLADPYLFTFNGSGTFILGTQKSVWIYYTLTYPAGQGLTSVPIDFYKVSYVDHASFSTGTVLRGETFENIMMNKNVLFNHPFENEDDTQVYKEIDIINGRKELFFSPLIETTSTKDGGTRLLSVETIDAGPASTKALYVPFPLQHVKGIYSAATGGTEVATKSETNLQISDLDVTENYFIIHEDKYIAELESLKYDPTGAFTGSEVELLINNLGDPGDYGAVFEHHNVTGDTKGTYVRLYNNTTGVQYDIPGGALVTHYRWAGREIPVRNGSGDGYDVNGFIIDCTGSDADIALYFNTMSDETPLWLDVDYLGAAHRSAQLKMVYKYSPYQGSDVGSKAIEMLYKRQNGLFFNNGTGGGVVANTTLGTSNINYTPLSIRLPGSFDDYLRDGSKVELGSCGTLKFDTDIITQAAYEVLGYYGGGKLWEESEITMPASPETTSRGFLDNPFLEVIFEDPTTDPTNAEFIMPLLVIDRGTREMFLFIQIGNKGVHKAAEGQVHYDIFRLNEKILIK